MIIVFAAISLVDITVFAAISLVNITVFAAIALVVLQMVKLPVELIDIFASTYTEFITFVKNNNTKMLSDYSFGSTKIIFWVDTQGQYVRAIIICRVNGDVIACFGFTVNQIRYKVRCDIGSIQMITGSLCLIESTDPIASRFYSVEKNSAPMPSVTCHF